MEFKAQALLEVLQKAGLEEEKKKEKGKANENENVLVETTPTNGDDDVGAATLRVSLKTTRAGMLVLVC